MAVSLFLLRCHCVKNFFPNFMNKFIQEKKTAWCCIFYSAHSLTEKIGWLGKTLAKPSQPVNNNRQRKQAQQAKATEVTMSTRGNLTNAVKAAQKAVEEAFLNVAGNDREERFSNDIRLFYQAMKISEITIDKMPKHWKISELGKVLATAYSLTKTTPE